MKAVIIDDSSQARKLLRLMLAEISTETEIVAEAENTDEALRLIKKHQPDLLFLDIEMPGKNGLQLIEELASETQDFQTIFITAYSQYAIQAFKLSAIDYLLKPFRKKELQEAVAKAHDQIQLKKSKNHLEVLLNNLNQDINKTISIPLNYGYEYLPINSIEYLEANRAYTIIYLIKGQTIMVSKNLKQYEDVLCTLPNFIKINRSSIVNIKCVKAYHKEDRGIVELYSGNKFKISPNCKEEFLLKMNRQSI